MLLRGFRLASAALLAPALAPSSVRATVPNARAHRGSLNTVSAQVLAASLATSTANVTTPTVAPISFFWSSSEDNEKEVPQCSTLSLTTTANNGSSVSAVPPFYFSAFGVGLIPEVQYASAKIGDSFEWIANMPVGTSFSLAMTDSAGSSGGAVSNYTIVTGSAACTTASNTTDVSVTPNPPDNACGEVDLEVTGGIAPYTASIVAGTSGRYSNATGLTGKTLHLANAIPAGQTYYVFVTDATGIVSKVSEGMNSELGQGGCATPTVSESSKSSSSLTPIIGGVVGSILGALVLISLGYWYFRRQQTAKAEAAHLQELNSADYRLADGTAPRITPFMLGPKSSSDDYSMVPSGSEHSPFRDDHSPSSVYHPPYAVQTPAYPSPYGGPSAHQPHPSRTSLPPLSASNTPSSPNTQHSGYPSYDSNVSDPPDGAGDTDARTGLVNPDAFLFRERRHPPPPGAGGAWGGQYAD